MMIFLNYYNIIIMQARPPAKPEGGAQDTARPDKAKLYQAVPYPAGGRLLGRRAAPARPGSSGPAVAAVPAAQEPPPCQAAPWLEIRNRVNVRVNSAAGKI